MNINVWIWKMIWAIHFVRRSGSATTSERFTRSRTTKKKNHLSIDRRLHVAHERSKKSDENKKQHKKKETNEQKKKNLKQNPLCADAFASTFHFAYFSVRRRFYSFDIFFCSSFNICVEALCTQSCHIHTSSHLLYQIFSFINIPMRDFCLFFRPIVHSFALFFRCSFAVALGLACASCWYGSWIVESVIGDADTKAEQRKTTMISSTRRPSGMGREELSERWMIFVG